MDLIAQVGIAFTGTLAIFLVGTKGRWKRYGFLAGLIGQPFWFYTTAVHEQWLIFGLAFIYTISWINGLRNHWRNK